MLTNYHIITVIAIPQSDTEPHRLKITSGVHGNTIKLSQTERTAIDTAAKYLTDNGFNIIGEGEGILNKRSNVKTRYLISDTFNKF